MAILKYVQTWTEYGFDSDNVVRGGVSQEEWAWNADEMTHAFNETTGVKAIGDCEDMAFLCGTIYLAAGFDAAIIDAPEHVALLIWLPEFSNANNYWDLPNDNRDAGWIWVEATGNSNPLHSAPRQISFGTTHKAIAERIASELGFSEENTKIFIAWLHWSRLARRFSSRNRPTTSKILIQN